MDFFKRSIFSDLKLQDVLALPREDLEAPISSTQEEIPSSDAEIRRDLPSGEVSSAADGLLSSDAEIRRDLLSGEMSSAAKGLLSSDATSLADEGSASPLSPGKIQEEQDAGLWSLGSLVKSIASKSEDIIQAYRQDLKEFGSGLRKETQLLAEAATHAVKDLPSSLETRAFMTQESIESVGQAVEDFSSSVWRGTADLIAQGKEAVLQIDDDGGLAPTGVASSSSSLSRHDNAPMPVSGGKYSRFEAQISTMQRDSSTYCDEPGETSDYNAWKSTFSLADKKEEIENLITENTVIQDFLQRFVPEVVIEDTFWTRYFYKSHRLHQTEEARADLVKRASTFEEEDLSWDTEEELEDSIHDEKYLRDKMDDSGKGPDTFEPLQKSPAAVEDAIECKAFDSELLSQVLTSENSVNRTVSKPVAEVEEDYLGWEVQEDMDESSGNDVKRSSNNEASWEAPDVLSETRKRSA